MKTKDILLASLVLTVLPMNAQETYQDVKMVPNELNGTARYVGMGGALEALGADISTIQSNPAGLGLFRKSWVGLSGGFVSQSDAETSMNMGSDKVTINGNKTNASFDQVGVVWSIHSDRDSYLNLAFNYDKSRNFDQILDAVGNLNGSSQNKNTALKYDYGKTLNKSLADMLWNSVDAGYAQMLTYDATNNQYGYLDGSMYAFGQYQKGYIGNYNFAISGNIHNRVYLGVTFGYYDVNYRSNSYYTENLENNTVSESVENLKIDGDGFDIKMGAIFFPIENSPFRIGLYINTPVFYDLTSVSTSIIRMRLSAQSSTPSLGVGNSSYNFRLNTPWKFGVSLGHTIDKILAFDL